MSPVGLFARPFFQALAWTLVHFLWQGILISVLLASANAVLKRRGANAIDALLATFPCLLPTGAARRWPDARRTTR